MNPFGKMVLASLIAAVSMTFMVSNANAGICPVSVTDTDGDCMLDSEEQRQCIDKADRDSREGMIDLTTGCAVSFDTCIAKRSSNPYRCGVPNDWNNVAYAGYLDGLRTVYEANGTPHVLGHDHMPICTGGPMGGWNECKEGLFLHVGATAIDGRGRKVKTGLPTQTPPFCHSMIIRASGRSGGGGGVDTQAREGVAAAEARLDAFKAAVEDSNTGLAAAHSAASQAQSTADSADRRARTAQRRGDEAYTAAIEAGKSADEALDLAQKAYDKAKGAGEVADLAWRELFVPKDVDCEAPFSRLDVVECIVRQTRRDTRNRDFVFEFGYAGNGMSVLHDKWERPALHGPLIRVGYRRSFSKWTFVARVSGTPINIGASGFSAGGHAGAAFRLFQPVKVDTDSDGIPDTMSVRPLPLFIGATLGGSGWSAGVYTPGSQGYSDVSGGGVDLDGVFFADIPNTPVTLSLSVGPRFHVVKASSDSDTLFVDISAAAAIQLRL